MNLDMLLATAIAVTSHALFFLGGLVVANHYNDKAEARQKDALERQFLRLQTHSDADDPCKPYKANSKCRVKLVLPEEFEDTLKANGKATAMLKPQQADVTSA